MRTLIFETADTTVHLTDESATSSHGLPVLTITTAGNTDTFGPADTLTPPDSNTHTTAAAYIASWATASDDLTADELAAARRYLAQWPAGPQIP